MEKRLVYKMKIKRLVVLKKEKYNDWENEDEIAEFIEEYGQLPRDRNELLQEIVHMINEVGE